MRIRNAGITYLFYSLLIILPALLCSCPVKNAETASDKFFSIVNDKDYSNIRSSNENDASGYDIWNYENKLNELKLLHDRLIKIEFRNLKSVIWTEDPYSAGLVIKGIERSVDFFKKEGIYEDTMNIEAYLLSEVPEYIIKRGINFGQVYGFVDRSDLRLFMPVYKVFLKNRTGVMNIELNEELYISYAAHEASHILTEKRDEDLNIKVNIEYQEYAAYTVQFETMKDDTLIAILTAFEKAKWPVYNSARDINYEYYLLNSDGFAVKSFLFYKTPEGRGLFNEIMGYNNVKDDFANLNDFEKDLYPDL